MFKTGPRVKPIKLRFQAPQNIIYFRGAISTKITFSLVVKTCSCCPPLKVRNPHFTFLLFGNNHFFSENNRFIDLPKTCGYMFKQLYSFVMYVTLNNMLLDKQFNQTKLNYFYSFINSDLSCPSVFLIFFWFSYNRAMCKTFNLNYIICSCSYVSM